MKVNFLVYGKLLMRRWLQIALLAIVSIGCASAEYDNSDCNNKDISQYLVSYQVFDVIRYSGGLTTDAQAKEMVGRQASLLATTFSFLDKFVNQPVYKLQCYHGLPEGEVTNHRWSDFYGFAIDRKVVEVIAVYDSDDALDEPTYYFEILGEQLWYSYDGWLVKMRKSSTTESNQKGN